MALRRWATIAGIALIVLIIAADSYEAWQDYRRVVLDNEHTQVALSRALTEQTERMVQEVDLVLEDYAAWMLTPEGAGADPAALSGHLDTQMLRLPFVSSAALTDSSGRIRASSGDEVAMDPTLKSVEAFGVPEREGGNRLYIDRPWAPAGDAPASFALSRRIGSREAGFEGVVIARVAFGYLARFYAGVNVTPDTSIRLSRKDGVTLMEYPASDIRVAGIRRIDVSQTIADYPIVVTVSRSLSSVLRPWIQEERSSAARTLTLAALAALLLAGLRSALRHQDQMDRERHRLEQELAAVQRIDALGFLAASVAHDFNNVLTAIIGYAELTREMVEAEPESVANVDRLLAATERARLLVRRVLTFDPRRLLTYRPTSIAPILIEVAQQIEATLPPSVKIDLQNGEPSATILGDATEIYQLVINLCTNAVHAMPLGGGLRLQLEMVEVTDPRATALGQLTPGPWVSVSIIDSGVGLDEQEIQSIFEPFYTTKQPSHGTGIGLTVVRNIILKMQGALEVTSRVGEGTRMTVYWPSVAPATSTPSPVRPSGEGAGQTIMVVDDERELVALTEELLASLSYEPVGFSDARLALQAFRHDPNRFDAILTDDRMQPMRGLEFARLVHELEPGIPILLMTGHRDAELDRLTQESAVTDVLDKPLRVQMLREALARQWRRTDLN